MAVITVSKIMVRSGLQQDLPALDTGEFGWSVDTQRLYIGKGTLAEGSPETGVTEVLTEYSVGLIADITTSLEANVANLATNVTALTSVVGNLQPVTELLADNQSSIANLNFTIDSLSSKIISYNIVRGTAARVGTIKVANYAGTTISFEDEYSETASTGVTLYFTGNTAANTAVLGYTTTSTGASGNISHVFQSLG